METGNVARTNHLKNHIFPKTKREKRETTMPSFVAKKAYTKEKKHFNIFLRFPEKGVNLQHSILSQNKFNGIVYLLMVEKTIFLSISSTGQN